MRRRAFLATGVVLSAGGYALWAKRRVAPVESPLSAKPVPEKPVSENGGNPGSTGPVYALIEERPGIKIYSSGADDIRAVAFAGPIEWVATAAHIQRVDRKRNKVRHFSVNDGWLQGEIQQLVGDEAEAFALIRTPKNGLMLCAFDAVRDRWEAIPVPSDQSGIAMTGEMRMGSDLLALGPDAVAYVPWYADLTEGESPAPYAIFDRKTRKLTHATWDPAFRANQETLQARVAAISGKTLWLGTYLGLIGAPLRGGNAAPTWECRLQARDIQLGVPLPEGKLALASQKRTDGSTVLEWVDLETGKTTQLPSLPESNQGQLLTTEGNTLWCLAPASSARGFQVYRLSPGKAWEAVRYTEEGSSKLVGEEILPDPIAGALVCQIGERQRNQRHRIASFTDQGQVPWLQQRFWRWKSQDLSQELPREFRGNGNRDNLLGLRDPKDPKQVWLTEPGNFVCVPRSELPTRREKYRITAAGARRFPISTKKVRHRLAGEFVNGNVHLLFAAGEGVQKVNKDGSLAPVAVPYKQQHPSLKGFVAGPARTCFVWSYDSKDPVLRWDEQKQALVETSLKSDAVPLPLGATRQGIWKFSNTSSSNQTHYPLQFLPIDANGAPGTTWQTITIELTTPGRVPNYAGSAADVLWFTLMPSDGKACLHIWNPKTRRWSVSETFTYDSRAFSRMSFADAPDGVGWTFIGGKGGKLIGYAPESDRWEMSAPLVKEASGFVVAATKEAVWVVTSDGVWRYSRAARTWSKPETAQLSFVPDTMFFSMPRTCTPMGDGTWWLGSYHGSWRFDPEQGQWSEVTKPFQPEWGYLQPALVTDTEVWGVNNYLLARLDRKTGKACFFGRESLPGIDSHPRVSAGAGRTWVLGERLHYFDSGSEQFLPAVCPGRCNAVASVPGAPHSALMLVSDVNINAPYNTLYLWEGNRLAPTPLPQPLGERQLFHLRSAGGSVYIATSDGLWRYQEGGRWDPIVPGMRFDSLMPDWENSNVVWAVQHGYGINGPPNRSYLVRVEV